MCKTHLCLKVTGIWGMFLTQCDPRKSQLTQEPHTSRKTRVFAGRCLPRYNLWQVELKPTGCQTPHNLQGLWPSLLGAAGYSVGPLTRQSSASVQCRQLCSYRCVQDLGRQGHHSKLSLAHPSSWMYQQEAWQSENQTPSCDYPTAEAGSLGR